MYFSCQKGQNLILVCFYTPLLLTPAMESGNNHVRMCTFEAALATAPPRLSACVAMACSFVVRTAPGQQHVAPAAAGMGALKSQCRETAHRPRPSQSAPSPSQGPLDLVKYPLTLGLGLILGGLQVHENVGPALSIRRAEATTRGQTVRTPSPKMPSRTGDERIPSPLLRRGDTIPPQKLKTREEGSQPRTSQTSPATAAGSAS